MFGVVGPFFVVPTFLFFRLSVIRGVAYRPSVVPLLVLVLPACLHPSSFSTPSLLRYLFCSGFLAYSPLPAFVVASIHALRRQ